MPGCSSLPAASHWIKHARHTLLLFATWKSQPPCLFRASLSLHTPPLCLSRCILVHFLILLLLSFSFPTLHSDPGNLFAGGEENFECVCVCVCVCVSACKCVWGAADTVLKGVSLYTVGKIKNTALSRTRGPAIKPLKYLWKQSLKCVWETI